MELKWQDPAGCDPVPFCKDTFDKFSLAPTMKELWAFSQSPDAMVKVKEESKLKPAGAFSEPKPTVTNQTTPQTNTRTSQSHSEPACDGSQTLTDSKNNPSESKALEKFPDPDVPYPRNSSLNIKERRTYLHLLRSRQLHKAPQILMEKVNMEIAEFMNYLQDVSKVCADAYKCLPPGANRYCEEYFKACLDHMKNYPQLYTIQEITSLTGGKFVSDISLNFEKQLLAMGNIEMVEKRMLAENTQLTVDYDSLSAVISPCKKARRLHTPISTDTNAEKLSAIYEPHVCLAKEAFLQLVNNSTIYSEPWELPVWVKGDATKGRTKTVYVDPPLLKTEMSWRERSLLLHEESLTLAYKTTGSNSVFFLTSEDYCKETDFDQQEKSSRSIVSFDDTNIDFEVDVTDFESFGESCQLSKKVKQQDAKARSTAAVLGLSTPTTAVLGLSTPTTAVLGLSTPTTAVLGLSTPTTAVLGLSTPTTAVLGLSTSTTAVLGLSTPTTAVLGLSTPKADLEECPSPQSPTEEARAIPPAATTPVEVHAEAAKTAVEGGVTEEGGEAYRDVLSSEAPSAEVHELSTRDCPPAKRARHSSVSSVPSVDSDEEHLVIDCPVSLPESMTKKTRLTPPAPESPSSGERSSDTTGPITPTRPARGARRGAERTLLSGHCDQLGQILRMQDAMLKATPGQEPPKAPDPAGGSSPAGRGAGHATSLVKSCVSSYLESREGLQEVTTAPVTPRPTAPRTRLLREDLLASGEDGCDYEPPRDGSLLYKLYSLQDVLLMVRSSVGAAHPRRDLRVFRGVPVHVLPKMEYQVCYGGESLTHSEVCQLWAEQILHSSTASFIGRISAHTSKLLQLQELPADWIQNTSCDFKPARCLNTLHHILKKLTSLQEGRYLLVHRPAEAFITIFKASDGSKPSRSTYDLQVAHCGLPVLPVDPRVPWLPLDPTHLMPIHLKHGRPPCTFPPRPPPTAQRGKGAKQNATAPGPQQNVGIPGQAQKKKKKKTKKWKGPSHKGTWTENIRSKQKKDLQTNQQ
ncbi:little elongation complex subunit 2 [Brachyhypopomus gauderio]|uniref:little elongation complex subunit 2 n=1 Tax=Brachyhypopomus gauderio TaxID=698409 RepID=UPI004042A8CA